MKLALITPDIILTVGIVAFIVFSIAAVAFVGWLAIKFVKEKFPAKENVNEKAFNRMKAELKEEIKQTSTQAQTASK